MIVRMCLFLPGVSVSMGPQTSMCIRSNVAVVLLSDFCGNGLRAYFPFTQHSHLVRIRKSLILIPDVRPLFLSSLIASMSR